MRFASPAEALGGWRLGGLEFFFLLQLMPEALGGLEAWRKKKKKKNTKKKKKKNKNTNNTKNTKNTKKKKKKKKNGSHMA